jgi:hypothetical protein
MAQVVKGLPIKKKKNPSTTKNKNKQTEKALEG